MNLDGILFHRFLIKEILKKQNLIIYHFGMQLMYVFWIQKLVLMMAKYYLRICSRRIN